MTTQTELWGPLIDALFQLKRALAMFGTAHSSSQQAARSVQQVLSAATLPCLLQLVEEGLFRDHQLVPLGAPRFGRLRVLAETLAPLHAQELRFFAIPSVQALLDFGLALAGGPEGLAGVRVDGLSWGPLRLDELESQDPRSQACAFLELASQCLGSGRELTGLAGLSCIRRLEQAVAADLRGSLRGLEMNVPRWTPRWRALSASLLIVAVTHELNVHLSRSRALAHACLLCAHHGYTETAGLPLRQAAERVLDALLNTSNGISSHQLRVGAALRLLTTDAPAPRLEALELVRIGYLSELRRVTPHGSVGRSEILANLWGAPGLSELWMRTVISTIGPLPDGSTVLLADGRLGQVIGPGNWRSCRPELLVGGTRLIPDHAVRLVPRRTLGPAASTDERRRDDALS